jgi:hypothetical protein
MQTPQGLDAKHSDALFPVKREQAKPTALLTTDVCRSLLQTQEREGRRDGPKNLPLHRGGDPLSGWACASFQVDGQFANRKLNELTKDELAAFEKRLANAKPQQQATGYEANE